LYIFNVPFFLFSSSLNLFHDRLNYCITLISSGSFNSCQVKGNVVYKFDVTSACLCPSVGYIVKRVDCCY